MIGFDLSITLVSNVSLKPALVMYMRLIMILMLIGSLILVNGCELHQVKGEVAGVEVEASTKGGGGDFCPPGQAKKGNC